MNRKQRREIGLRAVALLPTGRRITAWEARLVTKKRDDYSKATATAREVGNG